jgi:flagellin-like hook-associated protein FlgL
MSISALSTGYGLTHNINMLRNELDELELQLGTGNRSQTLGGLGAERNISLAARADVSSQESYLRSSETALLRLEVVQQSLGRIRENYLDSQREMRSTPYQPNLNGQTLAQTTAKDRLNEVVQLLNSELNGRYLFAGRSGTTSPVALVDEILEGKGGKSGLKDIIAERKAADMGADGRGRLVVPPAAGAVVALSEDAAGSPFGFKLTAVNNSLSGTATAGPAGAPPSLSVTFSASLPQQGEQITMELKLPDGSDLDLKLTATTANPPGEHEFTIGTTAAATATNFQNALVNEVEILAQTELEASSALRAGTDFFDISSSTPPQRVDGPPFDTATALKDGTTSDTVFWYKGDLEGAARDGLVAKVDDGYSISYGVRADEHALMDGVRILAVMAAETLSATDSHDEARYDALVARTASDLSIKPGEQSVASLESLLGYKQGTLNSISKKLESSISFSQSVLSDVEQIDSYEVGVRLLQLQTSLQASYQTTSSLSKLSLVNFM